jgi:hypothetical protein
MHWKPKPTSDLGAAGVLQVGVSLIGPLLRAPHHRRLQARIDTQRGRFGRRFPVTDQDAALAFYIGVLACELRYDVEVWQRARTVKVVPPGSQVGLVCCRRTRRCPWPSDSAPRMPKRRTPG